MVAQLCRLRLTLLVSVFRGSIARVLRNLLWGAAAIALAVGAAWIPLQLKTTAAGLQAIDTVLFALVLLAATVIPFFAHQKHLEPRQFATVPASSSHVGISLLITSVLSWPVFWMLTWLVALISLRPQWHENVWSMVGMCALAVVASICGSRVASALSKLIESARTTGVIGVLGALMVLVLLPITVFAIAETMRSPGGAQTIDAAAALAWTPFGAPIAGLHEMLQGNTATALAHFSVTFAWVLVLLGAWFVLVQASLSRIQRPVDPLIATRSMGWFDHFSDTPAAVIGARALTYWRRDPRYRVALAAAPIGAAFIVVALWIAGVDPQHIALIPLPLLMLLLGWSLHNDIATDSTAIWMHIVSGTRGRQDRLGRFAPVLFIGIPLALAGSSVIATLMGDWRILPALIGLNIAVLLVGCGVSSVSSAVLPYPTTRPNDSPFSQPAVSGSGGGAAQTISMLVTIALSVPPVWIGVEAVLNPNPGAEILALGFGLGYGAVISALGVWIGGAVFDRAGPVYIALTQTFD